MTNYLLRDLLKTESMRLGEIISLAQAQIESAPEGSLRTSRDASGNRLYYHCLPGSNNGAYIKKSDHRKVEGLAQKGYNKKVLKAARSTKSKVDALLATYGDEYAIDVRPRRVAETACVKEAFAKLPAAKKDLIAPYELPDEEYAQLWENTNGPGNELSERGCIYKTEKGDLVRSKSEVLIANGLWHAGVPYVYEKTVYFSIGNGLVHPDFTVLNKRTREETLWEHFGMMDDEHYRGVFMRKLNSYAEEGYVLGGRLIATFETQEWPLTPQMIDRVIREHFV